MAGYQGWFHNRSGGVMYPNEESVRIDMWPDVSEYEKTYPTGLKLSNGEGARFFCTDDEVNEGTAIFKVTDEPPVGEMVKFAKAVVFACIAQAKEPSFHIPYLYNYA